MELSGRKIQCGLTLAPWTLNTQTYFRVWTVQNGSHRGLLPVLPMRKLQNTAAGIPTVSQDTMVNNQEEARRRKAFSKNMAWKGKMVVTLLHIYNQYWPHCQLNVSFINVPASKCLWCSYGLTTNTYRVEASHAASGLTVFDIEEKEDVNGSQNKVEDSPASSWTYYVSLLGHHPESCTQPVHTFTHTHTHNQFSFSFWYDCCQKPASFRMEASHNLQISPLAIISPELSIINSVKANAINT